MASLAAGPGGDAQHTALTNLLRRWERRQRLQRTWLWLPRSLLPGLATGVALALWTRLRFAAPADELLLPGALLVGTGLLLLLAHVWLRPRPSLPLARKFEQEFSLNERLSTALELIEGRIHSSAELAMRQIADARLRAQAVDARAHLPLRSDRRAWALVLLALLAFGLMLRLPVAGVPPAGQTDAQEAAIDEAAAAVERISEELERDSALPEELRQQLSRELARTAAVLGQEALSPEEAFAALAESAEQLEQQALSLNESIRQQMQALESAQAATGAELAAALQQLQDALPSLPDGEDTASRLERAAAALEESNPLLAEALRQAAQALRDSQFQAASNSAQLASQLLSQQQQQLTREQGSEQRLQAASQQMRGSAEQIARQMQRSGSRPPSLSQQSPAMNELSQSGDIAQPGQARSEQSSQQSDQGAQPAALPGSSAQPGNQDNGQAGAQQGGQPGGDLGGVGESEESVPGLGGQAGDSPGDDGSDDSSMGQQGAPPAQNNNPDGLGEGEFAPVYAPRRIGATEGPQLFLETDPGDAPLVEGDFAPNPSGEALVPWNQIFGDYRDAASRALESDYIPLGLRDVVHDYFSGLEPGQ